MNKRHVWIVKVMAVVLIAALAVLAGPSDARAGKFSAEKSLDKFGRGLSNTAFGWMEIPNQVEKTWVDKGAGPAWTLGVVEGLGWGVARTAIGVYEVFSAPFSGKENYEPILTDPVSFLTPPAEKDIARDI
ncbi:MAG: exosortase system-associated protein, TIGR04073 family [Candidatus Omnitrophica bacterium]|nr:exosortase system-associated protein, TIGR04073 family [Candidatus Omnitrophota bacterium]